MSDTPESTSCDQANNESTTTSKLMIYINMLLENHRQIMLSGEELTLIVSIATEAFNSANRGDGPYNTPSITPETRAQMQKQAAEKAKCSSEKTPLDPDQCYCTTAGLPRGLGNCLQPSLFCSFLKMWFDLKNEDFFDHFGIPRPPTPIPGSIACPSSACRVEIFRRILLDLTKVTRPGEIPNVLLITPSGFVYPMLQCQLMNSQFLLYHFGSIQQPGPPMTYSEMLMKQHVYQKEVADFLKDAREKTQPVKVDSSTQTDIEETATTIEVEESTDVLQNQDVLENQEIEKLDSLPSCSHSEVVPSVVNGGRSEDRENIELEEERVEKKMPKLRKRKTPAPKKNQFAQMERRSSRIRKQVVPYTTTECLPKRTKSQEVYQKIPTAYVDDLLDMVVTNTKEHPEVLDFFVAPVIRRAIVNRELNCYAIAMIQMIWRVPQIISIIRNHRCEKRKCSICIMAELCSTVPSHRDHDTFVSLVALAWKGVDVNRQNCAMEVMQHFFNRFDLDSETTASSNIRGFFNTRSKITYKCRKCSYTNSTFDEEIYLSINLEKGSDNDMQKCLDNLRLPSAVSEYICSSCEGTDFVSTREFTNLPDVLFVFVPRVKAHESKKDMTAVTTQNEIFLRDQQQEHKYGLCAFLNHHGNSGNSGHYTMFEVDRSGGLHYNHYDDGNVIDHTHISDDLTIVLALYRKESAIQKDDETDIIFNGVGTIKYAAPRHCGK